MGDDVTELAGIAQADTESVYAYALDPDPEPGWSRRQKLLAIGAGYLAIGGCAAIVAAIVMVGLKDSPENPGTPSTSGMGTASLPPKSGTQAPSVPPVAAPPPVTVTVPPTTVTVQPPVDQAALDRQFITQLKADGFTITDPAAVAKDGRLTCTKFQSGEPPAQVNQEYADAAHITFGQALIFTSDAMIVYGCREP